MNQPTPPRIEQLVEKANQQVLLEQQRTEEALAREVRPSRTQQFLLIGLMVALVGSTIAQFPKFSAPFESVDSSTNATVAEADLEFAVVLVEAFRLSQGRYPTSLAEMALPETYANAVKKGALTYAKQGDDHFKMGLTSLPWQVSYDSQSKQLISEPASAK